MATVRLGLPESAEGWALPLILARLRAEAPSMVAVSYVGEVVEGSSLLATVPEPYARDLLKTHPRLRKTALPFALGGSAQELLWLRITDDDPVSRFVRGLIERALRPPPRLAAGQSRPATRERA